MYTFAKDQEVAAPSKHKIVIVGGGTGGVAVAGHLLRHNPSLDVAIIDPAKEHLYQPGWTFVGAGRRTYEWSSRPFASMLPTGTKHIPEKVTAYDPAKNTVKLASGRTIEYDQLVVATGMELNWKAISGATEALFDANGQVRKDSPVVSNYLGGTETYAALQRFPDNGVALFTTSAGIKCGGAPLKAALLSLEVLTKQRSLSATVEYFTPGGNVFPVARYTETIEKLFARRGVPVHTGHKLTAITLNPPATAGGKGGAAAEGKRAGEATFESPSGVVKKQFDLLHVVPPMRATQELRESPLADSAGYVDVDKFTCRSNKFPNVWSVGDASSLPTSKTAVAAIAESTVVAHNLVAVMDQKPGSEAKLCKYTGYTSCPLLFGQSPRSLLLMEFGYGGKPMESFGDPRECDGTLRGKCNALLKEWIFPAAYWHMMPRGMWYGPTGIFRPSPIFECSE